MKEFKTIEEARTSCEKQVSSVKDYFVSTYCMIVKDIETNKIYVHSVLSGICHADLNKFNSYTKYKILHVFSKIHEEHDYKKERREIISFLLKRSPWKYVYEKTTVKNALEKGIWLKTDVPNNVFGLAVIASRHAYEKGDLKHVRYMWKMLKNLGVKEDIRFLLVNMLFPVKGEKDLFYNISGYGHFWCNTNDMSLVSIKKYLNGKVFKSNKNIYMDCCYYKDVFKTYSESEGKMLNSLIKYKWSYIKTAWGKENRKVIDIEGILDLNNKLEELRG